MAVFYVSADQDFLNELAGGIKKRIVPELLNQTLIFLPSLRAAKLLEGKFNANRPRIAPIINIETVLSNEIRRSISTIQNIISPTETKFMLAQLLKEKIEDITYNEALKMSSSFLKLINRFEKEDIPLAEIYQVFTGDAPIHIQNLISYLSLISNTWPQLLNKQKKVTSTTRRNIFINILIKNWKKHPPTYPIIIAGSTGTFSSTRKLLHSISKLPNGFVIFQGLENLKLTEKISIDETHPCFQIRSLLNELEITPETIQPWNNNSYKSQFKELLAQNLFGSSSSADENECTNDDTMEYIECSSLQEESEIILLKIKELLAAQTKKIGIVTNDQNLHFMISTNLTLLGTQHVSSDGKLLRSTQLFSFLITLLEAIHDRFAPISLLKLLKHQLFSLGYTKEDLQPLIATLEIKYLRGIRKYRDIKELADIIKNNNDIELSILLESFISHCIPLLEYHPDNATGFFTQLESTLQILAKPQNTEAFHDSLYPLLEFIGKQHISLKELLSILSTLPDKTSSDHIDEANVYILTPIESRLMTFDYLIMAGLNERTWPESPDIDPWLSNSIDNIPGLSKSEASIGQAANDFLTLLQHKHILLTRSVISDNTPQVASRWLSKIEIWAQRSEILDQIKPQNHYLKELAKKNKETHYTTKYLPPSPKPPVELRPKKLSVTQIEKLIRDPYSIYASKILNLKPLEQIDKTPNQLEFGNVVHHAMDRFNKESSNLLPEKYLETILQIGNQILLKIATNPVIEKIWRPRFYKIASWLAEYEINIRKTNRVLTENMFYFEVTKSFLLTAKMDRIERNAYDHSVTIIDFKTGTIPTQEDIKNGFSPQLPLEGLLLSTTSEYSNISALTYIQLGIGKKIGQISKVKYDIQSTISDAKNSLTLLAQEYSDLDTPYLICPRKLKAPIYNEFDHLERLDEIG